MCRDERPSRAVSMSRKNEGASKITKPVDCSTGSDVFTHLASPVWLLVRGPHRRRRRFDRCCGTPLIATFHAFCIGRERYVRRTSNEARSSCIVTWEDGGDKAPREQFTSCPQVFFVMHTKATLMQFLIAPLIVAQSFFGGLPIDGIHCDRPKARPSTFTRTWRSSIAGGPSRYRAGSAFRKGRAASTGCTRTTPTASSTSNRRCAATSTSASSSISGDRS